MHGRGLEGGEEKTNRKETERNWTHGFGEKKNMYEIIESLQEAARA